MNETWLITGCSTGLGKALALEALAQGRNVIVTARRPETLAEFSEKYPQTALPLYLDVTDNRSIENAVKAGLENFGRIDVLVNNAGYCLRGTVEECGDAEILAQFDVNVLGTVRCIRSVLPCMRKAGKGLIINLSSIAAIDTPAGSALYGGSKGAIEGISGGLKKEIAPLGIDVLVIEPGPFATDFFNRSLHLAEKIIPDYGEVSEKARQRQKTYTSHWGDPAGAAKVIFQAAIMKDRPAHLLLGENALKRATMALDERQKEMEKFRSLILSA